MELYAEHVLMSFEGYHNQNIQAAFDRLQTAKCYKDLSTICIMPTRGMVHMKVVMSWQNLQKPMNQKFMSIPVVGMEVGEAYDFAVKQIVEHEELSKWKYILTLEEDNTPPHDGLLKLFEGIQQYDAVGGLYWTKGEGGMPMCYGHPHEIPLSFRPQLPEIDALTLCNGLGMGFTLFRLEMFKDPRFEKHWFKTLHQDGSAMTQDLYFFERAGKLGYKFACDSRVKVGHYDSSTGIVW